MMPSKCSALMPFASGASAAKRLSSATTRGQRSTLAPRSVWHHFILRPAAPGTGCAAPPAGLPPRAGCTSPARDTGPWRGQKGLLTRAQRGDLLSGSP